MGEQTLGEPQSLLTSLLKSPFRCLSPPGRLPNLVCLGNSNWRFQILRTSPASRNLPRALQGVWHPLPVGCPRVQIFHPRVLHQPLPGATWWGEGWGSRRACCGPHRDLAFSAADRIMLIAWGWSGPETRQNLESTQQALGTWCMLREFHLLHCCY